MSKSDGRFTVEQFFDFLRKIFASVFRLHKLCTSSIISELSRPTIQCWHEENIVPSKNNPLYGNYSSLRVPVFPSLT